MKKLFLISLISVLALTACGKGVSVGTEASNSGDVGNKIDVSDSRSMSQSSSSSLKSSVSLTQVLGQGMRIVSEVADINLFNHVRAIKYYNAPLDFSVQALEYYGLDSSSIAEPAIEKAKKLRAHLIKFQDKDAATIFTAEKLLECTDLVLAKDLKAKECYSDFYIRASAAATILAASFPQRTPGLDGGSNVDLVSKARSFDHGSLATWVYGAVSVVQTASKLQHNWSRSLSSAKLQNPADARLASVKQLFATPIPELQAALVRVTQDLSVNVSTGELEAPLEVFIPELNEYLVQNEKGLHIQRNGAPHFGDGYLEGYKVELALSSTSSSTLDRKHSASLDRASKQSESSKTGVSLN
jgi:hypothetical protein